MDSNRCHTRTERVDFSGNAPVYDRRHGTFVAERLISDLLEVTGLPLGSRILDVGAGTGRAAIAFARKGYSVIAVDASLTMLTSLRQKCGDARVAAVVGDATQLPFAVGSFDAAVIARLLYLVPDWRSLLLETLRVLKPGSPVFHEWANGSAGDDWVQIREQARALFEAAGAPFHPGARTEAEVDAFLAQQGARPIAQIPCESNAPVTMRHQQSAEGGCDRDKPGGRQCPLHTSSSQPGSLRGDRHEFRRQRSGSIRR